MAGLTLYDKLWRNHLVEEREDGSALIYIDRHLIHEVTSPQAFEGLRLAGRKPWRLDANLAVPDHNVPTSREERGGGVAGIRDIVEIPINDVRQGIVHVVGPEQGATLPGMTVVCGDSHTSTHGALGALAHGIGTSEVEHVLATQCLIQQKMKNMLVRVDGCLQPGVTAKDVALAVIGHIGTAGGTGYAIEFAGEVVRSLTMEGRMTLCNMSIEAGARMGMIAVDQTTLDYVKGRTYAPSGALWDAAQAAWADLHSDADAVFDKVVTLRGEDILPQVTWGNSPEMVLPVTGRVPDPESMENATQRSAAQRAIEYMGLTPGMAITDIRLDRVFIGMEWREPGCSMCLAMNADKLGAGEHCASTSNRNFEGRQGIGGRTHLVSPAMAAAAAIAGHFVDIRNLQEPIQ